MKNTKNKAFTLVELIVVITILAILWTIAFISLQWYSATSRNSVRVTDMKSMKTWLELYYLQTSKYAIPTWWIPVTYSWWTVWTQWTFWESVMSNVLKINRKPVDPLTEVEYTYSVTDSKQEFELWWAMEWEVVQNNILTQTQADWNKPWTAYI